MRVNFTILGEPFGKQRPRHMKNGITYTPQKTVLYEDEVRVEYKRQARYRFPDKTPLCVVIKAYYRIPDSAGKKKREEMKNGIVRPVKKPDGDNIAKIICDSLNEIAYHDDCQITDMSVQKWYSENPRVEVMITDDFRE